LSGSIEGAAARPSAVLPAPRHNLQGLRQQVDPGETPDVIPGASHC